MSAGLKSCKDSATAEKSKVNMKEIFYIEHDNNLNITVTENCNGTFASRQHNKPHMSGAPHFSSWTGSMILP